MADPISLKNWDRIRIRTQKDFPLELRPRGQDTVVEIVHADGTTTPIPDLVSAFWHVDSRTHYATAHFVARGVVVDVEGTEPGVLEAMQLEIASLKRQIAELEIAVSS
jgi:hypothetical protein